MKAITLILILALILVGCTEKESTSETQVEKSVTDQTGTDEATPQLELTLEELSKFNGEDGQPAYVAVDGIIYDMTNAGPWSGGKHNGYQAGNDLTEAIKTKSPHGVVKLKNVPAIGILVE